MVTMDDVDRAHIDANTKMIDFLTDIIKANKLHEPECVAFSLPKDHSGSFGFAASMSDDQCHCWLDKHNRAEPGKAFTWYHKETKELFTEGYINRYWTLAALLFSHPYLSRDKKSEKYWGKFYYIMEVTTNPTESTE